MLSIIIMWCPVNDRREPAALILLLANERRHEKNGKTQFHEMGGWGRASRSPPGRGDPSAPPAASTLTTPPPLGEPSGFISERVIEPVWQRA